MRELLCEECGAGYENGTHCIQEASLEGPAEWARTLRGNARKPQVEQMIVKEMEMIDQVWVTTQSDQLPTDTYLCDHCSTPIKPGDLAVAVSIWVQGFTEEPPSWESDFIFVENDPDLK